MEGLPKESIVHDYSCCAKATEGSVLAISTGHERATANGQAEWCFALAGDWLSRSAGGLNRPRRRSLEEW